jgi:hypothetical protein
MGWFVSLFTWGVPEETSNCAIDILLLKGRHSSKLIFELGLAFLHLEREKILQRNTQEDILMFFNEMHQG